MDAIKIEYQHYDYSEDELKAELDEAIHQYEEDLKTYNSAEKNGFVNSIVFHPETYQNKNVFIKVIEKSKSDSSEYSAPLANRKMADCTPEEQIIKINEREIRKQQIENNKQFEEVVRWMKWSHFPFRCLRTM